VIAPARLRRMSARVRAAWVVSADFLIFPLGL
jgi:hypothetical protein